MLNEDKKSQIINILHDYKYTDLQEAIKYLVSLKNVFNITWDDIAELSHEAFQTDWKEGYFRKNYGEYIKSVNEVDEIDSKILELKKERVKLSDERIQNNAYVRRMAREDTIREIAIEAAREIAKRKPLTITHYEADHNNLENEAILNLCDWHYGMEINNAFNKYNPRICRERVEKLKEKVAQYCIANNVYKINIMNLSDLIAGRIHLQLRLQSRIDVITQIMEVSEILANFLNDLSKNFQINYYSCTDNHSRLEPNKEDSLDLESLCRITDWFLKERLANNNAVMIYDNEYGDDIITFECLGHNIAGVHGNYDKPNSVINILNSYTHTNFDLICMAHRHHFSADESCRTLLVSSGSLMGSDSYAHQLRLDSLPSQNLIITSLENVMEVLYRITL